MRNVPGGGILSRLKHILPMGVTLLGGIYVLLCHVYACSLKVGQYA